MQLSHSNTLDALRRVQEFLDAQATALGAVVTATLRARLDDAASQLSLFQVEQNAAAGAAKGETANQAALRKNFGTQFMRPITRIAKAKLQGTAEYPTLTVARARLRKGDFLGVAQAFTDAAARQEKILLQGGLAVDLLTQMRAALAQLTASRAAQDRNASRRKAATQGIKDENKAGHDVLVVLDSVIVPVLKTNTSLLADWKASKRIVAAVTPLPPQPLGLPAATTASPPDDTTPAPTAPTTTPVVAPAGQAAKPAA